MTNFNDYWLNSNIELPRSRIDCNAWARSLYVTNAHIYALINLHATTIAPGSEFNQTKIKEFLITGELFLFEGKIMNPDFIVVKRDMFGTDNIFLRPDDNLRRSAHSDHPDPRLTEEVLSLIRTGENIPIPTTAAYFNRTNSYDIRGTSFLLPLFKSHSIKEIDLVLFNPNNPGKINKDYLIAKYDYIKTKLDINKLDISMNLI